MTSHHERKKDAALFYVSHERPEELAEGPLVYYTPERVDEYAHAKSLMRIQDHIARRIMTIAQISPPARVLDLGMGCGFATCYFYLKKYQTVGIDINWVFLKVLPIAEFNPLHGDMRVLMFRPDSFDLIVSTSAVQWLLAIKNDGQRIAALKILADTMNYVLIKGGKIVMQFYPKSDAAMKEMGAIFADTGFFNGNFIIDNPESPKKRRIYLYLEKK